MTREQARERCAALAAEHPDRDVAQWVPVQLDSGEWDVARVGLPKPWRDPYVASEQAAERPPHPEDPRSAAERTIPYYR